MQITTLSRNLQFPIPKNYFNIWRRKLEPLSILPWITRSDFISIVYITLDHLSHCISSDNLWKFIFRFSRLFLCSMSILLSDYLSILAIFKLQITNWLKHLLYSYIEMAAKLLDHLNFSHWILWLTSRAL